MKCASPCACTHPLILTPCKTSDEAGEFTLQILYGSLSPHQVHKFKKSKGGRRGRLEYSPKNHLSFIIVMDHVLLLVEAGLLHLRRMEGRSRGKYQTSKFHVCA